MSPAEFYHDDHLRDLFGATDGRPNAHRGVDFAGWPIGTPVPAWVEGRVVRSEWNSGLGWVVVVKTASGDFAAVSHLAERGAGVGAIVAYGETWGFLGNSGSLSQGQHAHLTLSRTSDKPWTGSTYDPLPSIQAAITQSAAAALDIETLIEELGAEEMAIIRTQSHGYYTVAPGVVISHPNAKVLDGIAFRKWGTIMDVHPDDLQDYLFALAGLPKGSGLIPPPGKVWYGKP